MNTDIKTGKAGSEDEGLIQLTLKSPSKHREIFGDGVHEVTALLTARGKDHDMSAEQLERLGKACLKYAKRMREDYL
jgi:hypothetical protein